MIAFISRLTKTRISLFLLAAVLMLVPEISAQGKTPLPATQTKEQNSHRILYLNLRSDLWPWLLSMYTESRDHLQALTGHPVEMFVDNTTFADIESPAARQAFRTFFQEQYQNKIDFIVVRRHFPQINRIIDILPDKPLIITDQNLALTATWDVPPANVHEVRYAFRIDKVADVALQSRPRTQKIIVIAGLAPFDKSLEASARKQLGNRYKEVDITYWTGVPVPTLKKRVAALPEDHLVLFLAATKDVNGTPAISANVVKTLSAVASVPIFGIADTFMPDGIVGGYVLSSKVSGRRSAEMIYQLLQGKALPGITYAENYGEYQFDWQQMRRWGISQKSLPADAIIRNRPDNFFERNTWFLPVTGVVVLLLILSLLALLWYLHMCKKVDETLQEGEEKFRILYNNSPDMYVSVSPVNAKIMMCNQTLLEKTGYTRKEILGAPVFKLYHPDCLDQAKAAFQEFIQTGIVQNKELILKRKDGRKIDVSLNVSAVRDESGKIVHSMSSWRDITEQKRMAAALQQSEVRYQAIAENAGALISEMDATGKFLYTNQEHETILGYKPADLLNGEINLSHPDEAEEAIAAFTQLITTRKPSDNIWRFRHKNGEWRWFRCLGNTYTTPTGETRVIVVSYDITEKKQAEDELKQQKEMFELVLNSVPIRIFWKDVNSVYLGCNPAFAKAAGEENIEDVIGKTDFELIWGKEAEKYINDDKGIINTGNSKLGYDESYLTPDGKKIWWHTSKMPLRDSDGKIIGVLSTADDFTERIAAEEKLRANEKRFRALFEQAGDYCMILDPNTKDGIPIILDASKSACEMHGYTYDEFIGRPVALVDDEEGKKMVRERSKRIMSGKPFFVENTHIRKDGTTFPVSVHANRIDIEGEAPIIFTTEYDISERKQAEEALQTSERRYRNLVENMNDLVYRYEFVPKRGFTYVSPSATRITGYTPEDHYADPDLGVKLVHPDCKEILENLTYGNETTPEPIVLKWVKKDGSVIWTEQKTSLVYEI